MHRLIRLLSAFHKHIPPYTLSLVWLIIILVLCWLPSKALKEPQWFHIPNGDKVVHATLFFIWAIFLQMDFRLTFSRKQTFTLLLTMTLVIAILTELLQPMIAHRTREWSDGLADVLGTMVGWLVFSKMMDKKMNRP